MLANGDQWATMSLLLSNSLNSTGIFRNEILMVATDGSGRVIRLAHHQSVYNGNYWNYPMANVSPDGRFIAFTSDFGSTNRRDVFILRVPYAGDANMDYLVDQADYTAWYNHYGQANATWADGDWNADRVVDQADYTLWYNNYGAGGAGVPEPASLSLLVLGGLAMIRRRKAA